MKGFHKSSEDAAFKLKSNSKLLKLLMLLASYFNLNQFNVNPITIDSGKSTTVSFPS